MTSSTTDNHAARSKRRLGRGLGSLISAPVRVDLDPQPPTKPATHVAPSLDSHSSPHHTIEHAAVPERADGEERDGLHSIDIDHIVPNRHQPRQRFDEAALNSLADSIRSAGLMQPVVVRPAAEGRFELIAGERRWRASQRIGLRRIPAVVHDVTDHQAAEWSLVENLQREDLNPIERAEAFHRLAHEFGMTHQAIAESVGLDRSSISNHLRLLELDATTRDLVEQGLLALGHARALLGLSDVQQRVQLASRVVREGWSVRTVEHEVKRSGNDGTGPAVATAGDGRPASGASAQRADLERRLSEHLGTKVAIRRAKKKGAGTVLIDFYSLAEFEGLMQRLGMELE